MENLIFTPENEPYLGRESLLALDNLIITCLEINSQVAPFTHKNQLTEIQSAASQIIPSGISLSLSIRELIRQGYLYGALVLDRPLAERAIILEYLCRFPDKVEIWRRGWKHRERPNLTTMIEAIGGDDFIGRGGQITAPMNSLTHGDPASSLWNLVVTDAGQSVHPVSKILNRPELCDQISMSSSTWLSILMTRMLELFLSDTLVANNQSESIH
jgi:hypothetical protein